MRDPSTLDFEDLKQEVIDGYLQGKITIATEEFADKKKATFLNFHDRGVHNAYIFMARRAPQGFKILRLLKALQPTTRDE